MIYPNPTQGLVTIDGEISHSAEVSIRIINYLESGDPRGPIRSTFFSPKQNV